MSWALQAASSAADRELGRSELAILSSLSQSCPVFLDCFPSVRASGPRHLLRAMAAALIGAMCHAVFWGVRPKQSPFAHPLASNKSASVRVRNEGLSDSNGFCGFWLKAVRSSEERHETLRHQRQEFQLPRSTRKKPRNPEARLNPSTQGTPKPLYVLYPHPTHILAHAETRCWTRTIPEP